MVDHCLPGGFGQLKTTALYSSKVLLAIKQASNHPRNHSTGRQVRIASWQNRSAVIWHYRGGPQIVYRVQFVTITQTTWHYDNNWQTHKHAHTVMWRHRGTGHSWRRRGRRTYSKEHESLLTTTDRHKISTRPGCDDSCMYPNLCASTRWDLLRDPYTKWWSTKSVHCRVRICYRSLCRHDWTNISSGYDSSVLKKITYCYREQLKQPST